MDEMQVNEHPQEANFLTWLSQKLVDLGETQVLDNRRLHYVQNLPAKKQYYIVMSAIKEWRQENAHLFGRKQAGEQS